jgi:hypothetical protein
MTVAGLDRDAASVPQIARSGFRDVATTLPVEHQSGHEVVAAAIGVYVRLLRQCE